MNKHVEIKINIICESASPLEIKNNWVLIICLNQQALLSHPSYVNIK